VDDPGQLEREPAGGGPGAAPLPVRIEVVGLSVYTHHGVGEAEREVGQRLVLDVTLELDRCEATATDRLEDTIDYGDVCREVASAAQARSHRTLERLCAALADHLVDRYGADIVTVRAAKPEPPIALAVDEVAVELCRRRS
jgi:dihydroneopterin aldolase